MGWGNSRKSQEPPPGLRLFSSQTCPVSSRGGFPDPCGFPLCFLFSGLHSGQLWLSVSTACLPVCGQRSALGPRFSEGSEKSRSFPACSPFSRSVDGTVASIWPWHAGLGAGSEHK